MIAVLLAVAGCGTASQRVTATTVTMTTTGGIAGVHQVRTVRSDGSPPPKLTGDERDRLFRLVGEREFRGLDESYIPAGYCCDQFHYTVTVHYEDGSTRRTATADGVDAPDVLGNVVDLLAKVQPR